jgi:4-hydroxyproline epimerase
MIERRKHFEREFDWIRTALMFEPRGHDAMSGAILYPPTRPDCDIAILYIEVSGCLAMCGHGTIGAVTIGIENGLIRPRIPGVVRVDTPAGVVEARYEVKDGNVDEVTLTNVPSFLLLRSGSVDVPGFGPVAFDVAYGGNFYAIIEPQASYEDLDQLTTEDIRRISPVLRSLANEKYDFVHPLHPEIRGLSHVMWTGRAKTPGASYRNAVFYGAKGIDRSPCGTGTSARAAQLVARGRLAIGSSFVHESIIGSTFRARAASTSSVGGFDAIVPEITGWARTTAYNQLIVDPRDPYAHGFQLP